MKTAVKSVVKTAVKSFVKTMHEQCCERCREKCRENCRESCVKTVVTKNRCFCRYLEQTHLCYYFSRTCRTFEFLFSRTSFWVPEGHKVMRTASCNPGPVVACCFHSLAAGAAASKANESRKPHGNPQNTPTFPTNPKPPPEIGPRLQTSRAAPDQPKAP